MQTDTDTEVIVNLLSYYFSISTLEESINKLINVLEGTWGLVIISIDEPNTIYATRFGSPLLVGYDEKNAIITSEQSGFCNKMNNYFILNNKDICIIKKSENGIKIETKDVYDLKLVKKMQNDENTYDHWMLKEIYDQEQSVYLQ